MNENASLRKALSFLLADSTVPIILTKPDQLQSCFEELFMGTDHKPEGFLRVIFGDKKTLELLISQYKGQKTPGVVLFAGVGFHYLESEACKPNHLYLIDICTCNSKESFVIWVQ